MKKKLGSTPPNFGCAKKHSMTEEYFPSFVSIVQLEEILEGGGGYGLLRHPVQANVHENKELSDSETLLEKMRAITFSQFFI